MVLASGPPLYLHKLAGHDVENAWQNALILSQKVATLILDHHLLRSLEGAGWLDSLSSKAPRNVVCCADFMDKPRILLEALRPRLYEEMPVPEDWHDSYAHGRARTDLYWDLGREFYTKRGLATDGQKRNTRSSVAMMAHDRSAAPPGYTGKKH